MLATLIMLHQRQPGDLSKIAKVSYSFPFIINRIDRITHSEYQVNPFNSVAYVLLQFNGKKGMQISIDEVPILKFIYTLLLL